MSHSTRTHTHALLTASSVEQGLTTEEPPVPLLGVRLTFTAGVQGALRVGGVEGDNSALSVKCSAN